MWVLQAIPILTVTLWTLYDTTNGPDNNVQEASIVVSAFTVIIYPAWILNLSVLPFMMWARQLLYMFPVTQHCLFFSNRIDKINWLVEIYLDIGIDAIVTFVLLEHWIKVLSCLCTQHVDKVKQFEKLWRMIMTWYSSSTISRDLTLHESVEPMHITHTQYKTGWNSWRIMLTLHTASNILRDKTQKCRVSNVIAIITMRRNPCIFRCAWNERYHAKSFSQWTDAKKACHISCSEMYHVSFAYMVVSKVMLVLVSSTENTD